jgi:formylglycine-generating enzyme required for sulfatase activity
LRGFANLADQSGFRVAKWEECKDWPELDDGFAMHAPVDSLLPNAWGFHHLHGNLFEWCRDLYGAYDDGRPCRPGDGLREGGDARLHILRGGSYDETAWRSRSSYRTGEATPSPTFGVRPARRVISD